MGHTRWATHGKPTTQNAHPHRTGHVVLVHNGIIENYQEIRQRMIEAGHEPQSETDSELFGFLVLEEMNKGADLTEGVRRAFEHVEGACSVVAMSEKEPGTLVGVRLGSPLVAALTKDGEGLLASDAQPILEFTQDVFFMDNGEMAQITDQGLRFISLKDGKALERKSTHLEWGADKLDKGGYPHYMLKEIHEQPRAIVDTLNGVLDRGRAEPFPMADQPGVGILRNAEEIILIACGTSYFASLLGKYWIEQFSGIPVQVEHASEFRYRNPVLRRGAVVVGVSQSGETADTLAVITDMKRRGIKTLVITNVRGSSLSREADATFYTSAGPEIGVAATKTFASQNTLLLSWAGFLAIEKGHESAKAMRQIFDELIRLPHLLEAYLNNGISTMAKQVAQQCMSVKGFFFIGRGYSYPIALEGALKLKEIAYIPAEGYAAGELKHGPIAMIDKDMMVVVLAPQDRWREKTISNLQEVKARGAVILGVGDPGDEALRSQCDHWVPLNLGAVNVSQLNPSLYPFLTALVVHLLSYEIAVLKGTDVDQPRNLAKSVTVE